MPTIISGDTGIDKIAAGAIEKADLPTGSVLQVVNAISRTYFSTATTGSWVDTGFSASITPTSASNKILVIAAPSTLIDKVGYDNIGFLIVERNGTKLAASYTNLRTYDRGGSGNQHQVKPSISFVDSPATTSSVTYKILCYLPSSGASTISLNATEGASPSIDGATESTSSIILMEIAG